jgi:hypothetical protein
LLCCVVAVAVDVAVVVVVVVDSLLVVAAGHGCKCPHRHAYHAQKGLRPGKTRSG